MAGGKVIDIIAAVFIILLLNVLADKALARYPWRAHWEKLKKGMKRV
jgi:hypothetical protein